MLKSVAGVLLTLLFALNASAQNDRKLGLVFAGPASIGMEWRLNDRFAIRPDVSASWHSSTTTSPATLPTQTGTITSTPSVAFLQSTTSISTANLFDVGVTVLVTVKKWDRLQAYLAPRAGISRTSTRLQTDTEALTVSLGGVSQVVIPARQVDIRSSANGWLGALSFGVRHELSDRFLLFGETGVGYSSDPSPSLISIADSTFAAPTITRHAVSTRGSVGVVLFF